jgi:integrase
MTGQRPKGTVRDLIKATSYIGARASELTKATVSQFNPRAREMILTGKTGTRVVKLSTAACAFFKRQAKGKKGDERLL